MAVTSARRHQPLVGTRVRHGVTPSGATSRPKEKNHEKTDCRRDPDGAPDVDYTGYEFWLQKLNQFNGNFIEAVMVKAFITSIEYRQRFEP